MQMTECVAAARLDCLMNRLASEFGGMVHRGQMHLFEQLPYDQIVELTQRDQLCTLSEYQVWSVVSHYINTHGHELHESEVAYLLRMVRYPLLTSVEILQVINRHDTTRHGTTRHDTTRPTTRH